MSLQTIASNIEVTPVSLYLQTKDWIIPTVQTVHILSIAIVIGAVLMVHLHTLGVAMRSQSSAVLAHRFVPWIWVALGVLLATGSVLITAEPQRSLPNWVFQLKMGLVVAAILLTLLYQQPLRKDPDFWTKSGLRHKTATGIAIVSLMVWVSIVFAGRWIAYAI